MITIPDTVWTQILDEFESGSPTTEQVCYLDGIQERGCSVTTTVVFPDARLEPGYFEVSSASMSEAGKHFRKYGLKRLAQIHTHPTDWTGHSQWDDAHAYSQLEGAISIVLPNFGLNRPSIVHAGVHMRSQSGWRQIDPKEVSKYVQIVPGTLDFRRKERIVPNGHSNIRPTRRNRWWNIIALFRY